MTEDEYEIKNLNHQLKRRLKEISDVYRLIQEDLNDLPNVDDEFVKGARLGLNIALNIIGVIFPEVERSFRCK